MLQSLVLYCQVNILRVFLFGIINGTVLLISTGTINFWLASYKVDVKTIGYFSIIILPQSMKYFVAILIDIIKIPYLTKKIGNQKAWLVISEISIFSCLIIFSNLNPENNLSYIALTGVIFSIFSVIQYVVLNGHRILILNPHEQAAGVATYNIGYRLGNFISTAGIVYLSIFLSWKVIFISLAIGYMFFSLLVIYFYQDISNDDEKLKESKKSIKYFLKNIINKFETSRNLIWIIIFVLIYQAADAMLMTMLNPFFLFKNYSQEEIANASKVCGLVMVIIGGVVGGYVLSKIQIRKSLFLLTAIHTISYVFLMVLSLIEKNVFLLYVVSSYTAFTGGMTTTAYFSLISSLSYGKNASSVYALLSSMIGLAWAVFPMFSGVLVSVFGWFWFYFILIIISILIILYISLMPLKIFSNNN